MASENIETAPTKRMFIQIPKKYIPALSQYYNLDHGLFITDLNPNIGEGYLATYFKEWGCITMCKIKNSSRSSKHRLAYVRFSSEDEADRADWAGPHFVGGTECKVRRIVSPKIQGESDSKATQVSITAPHRHSVGLGYALEDATWLDDEEETNKF